VPMEYVLADQRVPVATHFHRDAGIAVAGKVDEKGIVVHREEVDELRPAGRLAHEGEPAPARQGVQRARLAGVGAAEEGDLRNGSRGKLPRVVDRQVVAGILEAHGALTPGPRVRSAG